MRGQGLYILDKDKHILPKGVIGYGRRRSELRSIIVCIDQSGSMDAMDRYGQQAVEMLVGRRAQDAFDMSCEPAAVRARYGPHLWCQQALLARRLVEREWFSRILNTVCIIIEAVTIGTVAPDVDLQAAAEEEKPVDIDRGVG